VLVGFVQGYVGSLIAMACSEHFLKSGLCASFWLKWTVRVMIAATIILFIWSFFAAQYDLVWSWTPLAAVTAMLGTEVGRRAYDHL